MKKITLHTQGLLLLVLLELYFLGLGIVYWAYSDIQSHLSQTFDEDIAIMIKLPRLRADLIDLHMQTGRYLLSGNESWLRRRKNTLSNVLEIRQDLEIAHLNSEERGVIRRLYSQLETYLADQNQWIKSKSQGNMSLAQATRIINKDYPLEGLLASTVNLRNVDITQLRSQRVALRRAMNLTFLLALIAGFIISIILAFFVSRFITNPIQDLERFVSNWELGVPWNFQTVTASYEVNSLASGIQSMSQRLNNQYKQISELEHIKSQLVAMISHEFNNSLTVVLGLIALIQETEKNMTERKAYYFSTLKSNLRSLSIISTNLLNMGRLESGHYAVNPRRIEVRSILQDSLQRLEILYKRKNLEVLFELPETPVPVKADPEALSLVITNLLSNAIKYTPDGGRITIGIVREAGYADRLQVYVQDTGIGIAPEDIERIFSGYYRTDSSKKTAKGFGVGLVLAKLIVEAHNSSLQVESEPDKGSRFFFSLPVYADLPTHA